MAPSAKVVLFMGPPEYESIDWDSANLLSDWDPALLPLLPTEAVKPAPAASLTLVAWRSLPHKRAHFRTGFSFDHSNYPGGERVVFFSPATIMSSSRRYLEPRDIRCIHKDCDYPHENDNDNDDDDEQTQFYSHSLAIHGTQAEAQEFSFKGGSFIYSETEYEEAEDEKESTIPSFLSNGYESHETSLTEPLGTSSRAITPLVNIPSPKVMASFCSTSLTVNLVVAIISITPPFSVRTKWGPRDIVELIVGDETRSGFSITFWLTDAYRAALGSFRRQDVVLFRNIALSSFREAVHGNSLRGDMTKAHLLFRRALHNSDLSGHYSHADIASARPAHPQLEKTRRVRDWVLRFVGPASETVANQQAAAAIWNRPPEDTQE